MEEGKIVEIIITGITYLTPLAVLIWRIAKADSLIRENEKEIKRLKESMERIEIPVIQNQIKNLEEENKRNCDRLNKIDASLDDVKVSVGEIKGKLDILLAKLEK